MRVPVRCIIVVLAATTWATAGVVIAPDPEPLRVIGGTALALVLPGSILAYAVLPSGFGQAQLRLVLAFGLSASATIAVGIALALATGRVERNTAALALASLSTLAAIAAYARTGAQRWVAAPRLPRGGTRMGVTLAMGGIFLVVLFVLAVRLFSLNTEAAHFTSLSIVRGKNPTLALVENHEGRKRTYEWVVLRLGGAQLESGTLDLAEGQSGTIRLRAPVTSRWLRIELFLSGESKPYRSGTYVR